MAKFFIQRGIEYNGKIIKMKDLEKHNIFKINVFPYHSVEPFIGEYAKVSKKWTYEELCNLDEAFMDCEEVKAIKDNGIVLYGYINRDGKEIVPPFNEDVSFYMNGAFLVLPAFEDGFNWVDGYGDFISEHNREAIFFFSNDRAMFKEKDKYNFITIENGEPLDSAGYAGLMPFTEGLAAFKRDSDSLWGYINIDNEIDIKPEFKLVKQMVNNMAAVMNEDNKWGYIDCYGKLVIDYMYDNAFSFNNDLAIVLKDLEYLLINKNNEIIKELDDNDITYYYDDLVYGTMTNKCILPCGEKIYYYVDLENNSEKYLTLQAPKIVKKGYRYKLVNPNDNKVMSDIEWHYIKEFENGYGAGIYNKRVVHIDSFGEPLINGLSVFDINTFSNNYYGYFKIESGKTYLISAQKKYGLIIKNDKVVSEVWFDNEDEVTAYIKSNEDNIDKIGKAKVYIRS
jgi:hypothetical protein